MTRRTRAARAATPRSGLLPKLVAALAVVALVAGAYAFWPRNDTIHVTGDFTRAVGLFPGSDVRILGVKVGTVDSVTPEGDRVKVTFEFDRKYRVPADAKAAVVAPSLVSDRYVQLLPAYTAGPVMHDGAHLGLDHTAVPVELDRISSSLNDLLVALGPTGANKNGAFQDLLHTGARNLAGQGQNLHDTNHNLSLALQTLAGGRNDLFGTVKNLQTFTSTLAANDPQVRRLNTDLASVADQLSGERDDLGLALQNLAVALGDVSTFVHDNRSLLTTDVTQLAQVTGAVAQQKDALAETLRNAPVALSNLGHAYDSASGTLDNRVDLPGAEGVGQLLCGLVGHGTGKSTGSQLCDLFDALNDRLTALGDTGTGDLPLGLLGSRVPGGTP
jgi:phospholipid/cholesterol/gamma-HCH transport system substrate-binding protein